jgi:hypothetical protein
MISTYTELKAAIQNWLVDNDLDGNEDNFIQLAESFLNRELKCEDMVAIDNTIETVASNKYIDKPDDFIEARALKVDGVLLTKTTSADIAQFDEITGIPTKYAIVGSKIQLYPIPSGVLDVELVYLQRLPALSNVTTTNWLLTKYPDLYLYSSLVQAAIFNKEEAFITEYNALVQNAINGIKGVDEREKLSGSFARIIVDPRIVV